MHQTPWCQKDGNLTRVYFLAVADVFTLPGTLREYYYFISGSKDRMHNGTWKRNFLAMSIFRVDLSSSTRRTRMQIGHITYIENET